MLTACTHALLLLLCGRSEAALLQSSLLTTPVILAAPPQIVRNVLDDARRSGLNVLRVNAFINSADDPSGAAYWASLIP